ncbi:TetR/AcrR family transcriptional regulator [Hyphomonadaceae bacterium ML37]|nr:TetR/AcrR family transcriptional regulator [Hyphomonadaceae bacterium ML37]
MSAIAASSQDPARRPGRPAKLDADGDNQRQALLQVASAHFARAGFDGASLRAIADEAALAHGLIRHYFGSKDALWEAAADFLFGQVHAAMAEAIAEVDLNDAVARLDAQVRATVRTAARIPHLAGFVMQAGIAGGPRYEWIVEKHLRPAYAFALEPFHQLTRENRAAGIDAHFAFILSTNAALGPFAQSANSRALAGMDMADPDIADAYADTLIAILKHGVLRQS